MRGGVLALHNLPDRDQLRAARALLNWWGVPPAVLRKHGFRFSDEHFYSSAFDPIDDPVAIRRAVDGDRAVYEALTHYERLKVRQIIQAKSDAVNRRKHPYGPNGLTDWCKAVGVDFVAMQRYIVRARAKARKAAAE